MAKAVKQTVLTPTQRRDIRAQAEGWRTYREKRYAGEKYGIKSAVAYHKAQERKVQERTAHAASQKQERRDISAQAKGFRTEGEMRYAFRKAYKAIETGYDTPELRQAIRNAIRELHDPKGEHKVSEKTKAFIFELMGDWAWNVFRSMYG